MTRMITKSYSELIKLSTFEDRFNYLKIGGAVGIKTFGENRYLNQQFYTSGIWRSFRDRIIVRDKGLDLGLDDIFGNITVHHIIPITIDDILSNSRLLFDPENVICVSDYTHKAIHYGDINLVKKIGFSERKPNDTCPWKH